MVRDKTNKTLLVLQDTHKQTNTRNVVHPLLDGAGFISSPICCVLLQVPGVSENRPSVLRGDAILVTRSGDSNKGGVVKYRGYVHRVELDSVKLGFNSK